MKISTHKIISAVMSLFIVVLASAQVNTERDVPTSVQEPGSAPFEMAPPNVSSSRGQSVAISGNMDDYAMHDEYMMDQMMMEEYGLRGPEFLGPGRKIFVMPATEIEIGDHLDIERDIRVMSHIFDRVLKKPVNKLGGVFTVMDDFFGRDSRVTQVIYLDGYGALFFMNVDFALVGPPQPSRAEEPNEPGELVDTTWQQAERELYAPPGVGTRRSGVGRRRSEGDRQRSQYDAGKVELLKKNLVETLKHAANIRALKADESVVLTIVGRSINSGLRYYMGEPAGSGWIYKSGKWVPAAEAQKAVSHLSSPPSVLTIRAKKADIDAFSTGELDFDKFYERTQLMANWSGSVVATRAGMSMMR